MAGTSIETGNAFLAIDTFSVVGAAEADAARATARLTVEIDVEHACRGVIIALAG